ncbi:MAG: sigma-70 family RNA polymerase sigma factor [Duncaniella freteri]|nr:sigma-70 family RNA polymerase sigma factor [Duncaniella freteri]
MAQNYEDIVREWYNRLRPEFLRRLTAKYSGLSLYDAENLYQDTFIAVQENLMLGRIKEDTSWSSYIMTIGMNMASKAWRKIGKTDSTDADYEDSGAKTARKVDELLKTMPTGEDEIPLYKNEEALSLLGDELIHTPEPCGSIIRLFYYEDMSMDEIAEEIGYKNATTAKAKKSQCMSDLIERVSLALRRAGFDVTPKRRNRNGKN